MKFELNQKIIYNHQIATILDIKDNKYHIGVIGEDLTIIQNVNEKEIKKVRNYKLSYDDAYNVLSANVDLDNYFKDEFFDISVKEYIEFNIELIYNSVIKLINKSKEEQYKWLLCYKQLIDLTNGSVDNVDSIILFHKIKNKINEVNIYNSDFIAIYNDIVNSYNSLSLPYKDRYKDKESILIFLRVLFKLEGKYNEDLNEAYRYYLDLDCINDELEAFYIRAYSYYGGNSACPCDYKKAEAALLKLYASGDTYAANSLGYIYYYGRVNNGAPQYDLAFKYFTISALDNEPEAIIKLSDMIKNGYGVTKNENLAIKMLLGIADKELAKLENNKPNKFADTALRLGSYHHDNQFNYLAFVYYSYAKAAMKIRNKEYPMFGDQKVNYSINKGYSTLIEDKRNHLCREDAIINILQHFLENNTVDLEIDYDHEKGEAIFKFQSYRNKLLCNLYNNKSYLTNNLILRFKSDELYGEYKIVNGTVDIYENYICIEDEDFNEIADFEFEKLKLKIGNEIK